MRSGMATLWENLASRLARRGLGIGDALLFCGVCAFFFFLPLRTDATAAILAMTFFSLVALRERHAFRSLLTGGARLPLLGFGFFLCVALAAGVLNPATLPKFPRVLLWGCCVFSGAAFSVCLKDHGNTYFWALFAALAGSFAVAAVWFGYDAPRLWHADRLKLFAIHPSRLGLYCAICLFFLLYRSFAAAGLERLLSLGGALLVFFLLFSTNTRGNLLMLPVGLLCLGLALPRRYLKQLGVAVLLCAVLGGATLWLGNAAVSQRLVSALTDPLDDPTFKSRVPIWEIGWRSFTAAPVIGHGHQSYLDLHGRYIAKHEAEMDARYGKHYEKRVKQAHNIILGRLVETGILGTAGFLLFYCGAIAAAWRGPRVNRWLLAPLVFYLAMSLFDDGLFRMNDAFILFVAGVALGGTARPMSRETAPRSGGI